jgi:hypothetical protein
VSDFREETTVIASGLPVADELAIRNLLARYGPLLDEGAPEDWAALFTEDGSWHRVNTPPASLGGSGLPAEIRSGRAVLTQMAKEVVQDLFRRRCRHQMTDVYVEAGLTPGSAVGFARALITDFRDGPGKIAMVGSYRFEFVRLAEGWRIKSIACELLPTAGA